MAEEFVLTDPVVEPAKTVNKYKVMSIQMDSEWQTSTPGVTGLAAFRLQDNLGNYFFHQYEGETAMSFIKFVNTGNFTTKSLQRRILERLTAEGVLPPGNVQGTPDPVVLRKKDESESTDES